mgnify:CR=1 FL=1
MRGAQAVEVVKVRDKAESAGRQPNGLASGTWLDTLDRKGLRLFAATVNKSSLPNRLFCLVEAKNTCAQSKARVRTEVYEHVARFAPLHHAQ